jgi:hypothetical protein
MADEATAVYRDILRPTQGEIKKVEIGLKRNIDDYYKLAAEEGVPIRQIQGKIDTHEAIDMLKPKVSELSQKIDDALVNKTTTFNLDDIADSTKRSLVKTVDNADELRKSLKDVDRYINAEKARYGDVVTASQAHRIKKGLWQQGYDHLRPTAKRTSRKLGHVIKKQLEDAFPGDEIAAINRKTGDYMTLIDLLENAQGRVVKGGRLGKYFASVIGTQIGGPGGTFLGGKIFEAMNNPETFSALAARRMREAMRRMPKVHTPELVTDLPISKAAALGGPVKRTVIPSAKTKALPSPRDIPYNPTGSRNVGQRPIRMGSGSGEGVIYGENPVKKIESQTIILPKKKGRIIKRRSK